MSSKNNIQPHLEILTESPPPSVRVRDVSLLFVHGMCHAAWCWREHFLPWFARQGYSAHALSLRGHGGSGSEKPLRSVTLRDYVNDTARAAESLLSTPVPIGHSMGGLVVQKYLEGNRVPAAVLMASAPPFGMMPAALRFGLRRPGAFLRMLVGRTLYPMVETPRHCRDLLFSERLPDEMVKRYQMLMQDESYRAFWDGALLDLPRPKRVDTPLLVLGAEEDRVITRREVRKTARAYGTRAQLFPDMPHDMMLEPGWRDVAGRILEWLDAQGF